MRLDLICSQTCRESSGMFSFTVISVLICDDFEEAVTKVGFG